MRSGYFKNGVQFGEWTTYDQKGAVYKVTVIKQKIAKAKTRASRAEPSAKSTTRAKQRAL
jgi:antitoxin component YwqK of YwqJK toxin-antitoxin module